MSSDISYKTANGYWSGQDDNGGEYKVEAIKEIDRSYYNNLRIAGECLKRIPRKLGSTFPHLTILRITHCELESISRGDLAGLAYIQELDVTGNKLKSLPDDLFIGKGINWELLMPILKNGLERVDLRGNRGINDCYVRNDFVDANHVALMKRINANNEQLKNRPTIRIESFSNDFFARFAELRVSGRLTDLTIVVDGPKELRVHMTVLAVQSPVFEAMFESDMSEKTTGKMTITDFSADAVEQFIDCLYTGEIKDAVNAMELFGLAAKYDVPKLKAECMRIVINNVNQTNAFDVFALGHLHSEAEMQRKALDVIKQKMPELGFDESLMDDQERLKAWISAIDKRNKRMREAEEEFGSICKKINEIKLESI